VPTPTATLSPTPTPTPKYPKRGTLFHHHANVTVGNALQITVSNSSVYCYYAQQNPGASGDTFTQGAFLKAGTYAFDAIGLSNNDSGIVIWTVDAVTVATQDWYSKSFAQNTEKTAPATITTDGWHKLQGYISGKNVSSNGYYLHLSAYYFVPADDEN